MEGCGGTKGSSMSSSKLKNPTVVTEGENPTVIAGDDEDGHRQAQARIILKNVSTTHATPVIGNTVPDTEDSSNIVTDKKDIRESSPDKKETVIHQQMIPDKDDEKFDELYKQVDVFKTVTVQIINCMTEKSIHDFSVYVTSGKSYTILPDGIAAGESKAFLFFKTPWSLFRGVVGILTFGIQGMDDGLVIYFCNPFFGHNEFGLDWIQIDRDDDSVMREQAKSFWQKKDLEKKRWVVRGSMKKKEITLASGYRASGFMTQGHHVKMTVKIFESEK